jgi:hypothetical protein
MQQHQLQDKAGSEANQPHLVFFQHGLNGGPHHWKKHEEVLKQRYGDSLHIVRLHTGPNLCFACSHLVLPFQYLANTNEKFGLTWHGIDVAGERAANEVR